MIILLPSCFFFLIIIWRQTRNINFHIGANPFFWCFIFLLLVLYVYSSIIYSQGLLGTLKYFVHYMIPLFAIFTFYQFPKSVRKKEILFHAIQVISIIDSFDAIVNYLLISKAGINLLNISYSIRNGTPRFGIGTEIVIISLFVSFASIFKSRRLNFTSLLCISLGLIQLIAINKTRSVLLYVFFSIIVFLFLSLKLQYKFIAITILALCLFMLFPAIPDIANSVTEYINGDGSILIRLEAIDFYMNQFYHHPLIGMGFISSHGDYWYLGTGYENRYFYNDVGLVGFLVQFGSMGLLLACYFFIHCIKSINHLVTLRSYIEKLMIIYFVVSSINLSLFDPERLIYLFLLFAIDDSSVKVNLVLQRKKEWIAH